MTDIENEYEGSNPNEERVYRKTSSALLKGFTGIKLQKSNDNDVAEAIATSPELLKQTRGVYLDCDMDVEKTGAVIRYLLWKSGVSLPKIDDTARTAIGSVTGGQVPKKKLPEEVQEGLDSMEHAVNRLSPGMPEAQISTRGTAVGGQPHEGYTYQNQVGGADLNSRDTTSYTAPIGRVSTPEAQNLRTAGGQNPGYSVGRGQQGEVGSPGQSGQYEGRGHLPYSSISQKPGDTRTTYKYLGKPGSTDVQPQEKLETITKSRHLESPKIEPFDTFLVKHMTAALFKGAIDNPAPITAEAIGQSMHEEDEAREAEAHSLLEEHYREEDEVDEADEAEARKFEADADALVRKARQYELAGDWRMRDEYLYLSKLKRGQALGKMRSIASRHGNRNFPTGL